jgi:hypothetical protein
MRRLVVAVSSVLLAIGFTLVGAQPASAEFKFGPHDIQCQAQPDQPNCVGGH